MAELFVDALAWGEVTQSRVDAVFPCIDSSYKELKWSFNFDKLFDSFGEMIAYEQQLNTFSNREKDVSYASQNEVNMTLQSIRRLDIPMPIANPKVIGHYEAVFTKEGA